MTRKKLNPSEQNDTKEINFTCSNKRGNPLAVAGLSKEKLKT